MANNRNKMPPAEMPVAPIDSQEGLNEAAVFAPPIAPPVEASFVSPAKVQGAEVVALRPGFYKGERKKEGEKFFLFDVSKIGDWMEFSDPKIESDRQKAIKEKKKAASK